MPSSVKRLIVSFAVLLAPTMLARAADDKCAGLTSLTSTQFPNDTTIIRSAVQKPPSEATTGRGAVPALPEHCEVFGRMNDRTGADGQHYAINFHMRMPTAWNGKFFFEGGGGSNGNIGGALGNLQGQQPANALVLGYAVVTQDSGHDNAANNDPNKNGTQTFGFDEQARLDFGYNSYDQVTQAAKALIRLYYGKGPERSYYVGCSEGGREGMMMSQRFPDYFDGILACSPGFKLAKAAIAEAWDTQAFAGVAKADGVNDPNGEPFVNKTFSDEDLALVSNAVLSACDKLDGAEDGMIANFHACTSALVKPKLEALGCKGQKDATCLTAVQIAAIERVFGGAKNSKGETLYADWPWDVGMGGKSATAYNLGWRVWKLGMFNAPANSGINATLGAGALSGVFTTPPTPVASAGAAPVAYLLGFNFDSDAAKIYAESGTFAKSVWDFMMASSTDLSAFRKHGGKLILTHGVSDPVFSIDDDIAWLGEVNKVNKGKAGDFVRLFAIPGMNHCAGGPATDRFDAFTALVKWVEKKTAPEKIVASAGPATPWPNRTRPLCPYPAYARYKGTGSIEDAGNFVCK
ncbi:MAG TPA: tannase/feruloyl esterase family alpha/beta hydrolase [Bryobacteraceae bacterium]|nr:tannase/feruloyl esterase family alpha/beta hydrolase [Bryobacteraceae bacterium]